MATRSLFGMRDSALPSTPRAPYRPRKPSSIADTPDNGTQLRRQRQSRPPFEPTHTARYHVRSVGQGEHQQTRRPKAPTSASQATSSQLAPSTGADSGAVEVDETGTVVFGKQAVGPGVRRDALEHDALGQQSPAHGSQRRAIAFPPSAARSGRVLGRHCARHDQAVRRPSCAIAFAHEQACAAGRAHFPYATFAIARLPADAASRGRDSLCSPDRSEVSGRPSRGLGNKGSLAYSIRAAGDHLGRERPRGGCGRIGASCGRRAGVLGRGAARGARADAQERGDAAHLPRDL